MIIKQSSLDLNGPILSFIQHPESVTLDNDATTTFIGIATATGSGTGTLSYRWSAEGFGSLSDGLFQGATLTGTGTTTLVVSNVKSPDTNQIKFFLTVDYVASAYSQPVGSAVTVGTARSTGNAINEILNSNSATLTVNPFIAIINQPQNATVVANSKANFYVDAELSDDRFGSLSYQWQLNEENLSDQNLIQGSNQSTLVITTSSPLIQPSLLAPVCISVIDESSPSADIIRNDWLTFRANHPNRYFWLLQPTGFAADRLKIPSEYTSDSRANGPVQVSRDNGNTSTRSDWFEICNLSSYSSGTTVSLAIDNSGSTTLNTVKASYDLFKQKCSAAGLVLVEEPLSGERWAVPHDKNLPSRVSDTTCVSVIDESSPSAGIIRNDWLTFRANHPNRYFWLLQPGRTPDQLKVPSEYTSDSRANGPVQVSRDNGNTSTRSDWFEICNLQSSIPGSVVSLAVDNSGSMTLNTVKASYDLFKQKCSAAGLVLVEEPLSGERWAVPHDKNLPEQESTTVGISTLRVIVSNPNSQTVISNNAELNVLSTLTQKNVNFEYIPTSGTTAEIDSVNLFDGEYTLTNKRLISFYSPEIDIDVEMDLYGGKGIDVGSNVGGEGGFSRIRFTIKRNIEYIIAGLIDSINTPFIYRKSTLIACVGSGGDAGTGGNGGFGGGIGIGGQTGFGRGGVLGGSVIFNGTLSADGIFGSHTTLTATAPDTKASTPNGGRVLPCTRGIYWRNQGISACSDVGTTQFRLSDGTIVSNTASIERGYKAGYNIIQTSGAKIGNGGKGGNGATGGQGGDTGGGGGGSGYTDGSVTVVDTQLGGSNFTNAKVVLRVVS